MLPVLRIRIRISVHEKLDPDPHQSQSQKQDPDPRQSQNSGAVGAHGAIKGRRHSQYGAVEAQNVAWRVLRSVVADSHHFDEEQDFRIRNRIKMKRGIGICI
jgi:hypothetical protein